MPRRQSIYACLCAGVLLLAGIDPLFAAAAAPAPAGQSRAAGTAAGSIAPKAVFQTLRHRFEPVLEGDTVTFDFIVENQGTAPLVIKSIRPD